MTIGNLTWDGISTLLTAVVAAGFVVYQLKHQEAENRKKNTLDLLDKYFHNETFNNYVKIINEYQKQEKDVVEQAAINLLNLYEDVAIR